MLHYGCYFSAFNAIVEHSLLYCAGCSGFQNIPCCSTLGIPGHPARANLVRNSTCGPIAWMHDMTHEIKHDMTARRGDTMHETYRDTLREKMQVMILRDHHQLHTKALDGDGSQSS